MKLSMQLAKLKRRKQRQNPDAVPGHRAAAGAWGVPRWAWLAFGLLLAGGGTLAVLEFFIWNRLPEELVGTWVVQEGPMAGGTFAFSRDGTLKSHVKNQGTSSTLAGHVTLDGKTLRMTTHNAATGEDETHASYIRELTATSLVVELEKGDVLKMVRRK
jgi:uncharacterized protein (TIGR03066 family)